MSGYEIRPFNLRAASEAEYACLVEFKNTLRREYLPEDPPIPCDEAVRGWRALPAFIENAAWAAWDGSQPRILAYGECEISHSGDNEHEIDFRIEVLPEYRRRGLGRELLARIVEQARSHNRRLLITQVMGDIPAGDAFLSSMGGRRGLEEHQNQLRLADLDRGMLAAWLEQASGLSADFCLGWWDERYPEDRMQELADLLKVVVNDSPRDTLELEDFNISPEIIRQFESMDFAEGQVRWTAFVTDRRSGRLLGLTEVFWHPNRPAILRQGFTGVLPEYRGKGLGRWLKAAMLARVLRERPNVEVLRTGNADSNGPMLKINTELGFRPYFTSSVWQVDREAAEQYLAVHN